MCACLVPRDQKSMLYPLKLELYMIVWMLGIRLSGRAASEELNC